LALGGVGHLNYGDGRARFGIEHERRRRWVTRFGFTRNPRHTAAASMIVYAPHNGDGTQKRDRRRRQRGERRAARRVYKINERDRPPSRALPTSTNFGSAQTRKYGRSQR